MRQKYRKMENQKPLPVFALNQNFAEERELKQTFKKVKMPKLGDVLSKLVLRKRMAAVGGL